MKPKVKATFYVDPDLLDWLREQADETGRPQGVLVETAITLLRDSSPARGPKRVLRSGPGAALEVAQQLRADGTGLAAIADKLNDRGFTTSRGREWSVMAVSRLLAAAKPGTPPTPPKRTRRTR